MSTQFKGSRYKRKASRIPEVCHSLADVKTICKFYGINNTVEYKQRYREIPGLMSHPERTFAHEWVSYNDLFDMPEFILYKEMKRILHPLHLKSQEEYKKYLKKAGNPRYPYDPQGVYGDEWENWYKFLGKEEPFKVEFIADGYRLWGEKINEFMRQALGGGTKVTHICRFVRIYIEAYDKSLTPQEFLTKEKVNIQPFKEALAKFKTDSMRRNVIISVNEFLNFVIENDLTMEDEETGEIIRVMEARNPLALMSTNKSSTAPVRSETTKPCLQYHFVRKVQSWIIPEKAKHFSDLKHLHVFDADWVKVSAKIIDRNDPDCVYKKIGKQYFLWAPVDWLHTYTLAKVPLRGRQIAYNDSGEADEYVADLDETGKIIWVENKSKYAKMTSEQSFLKRLPDGHNGMYITTNKTSNYGRGYTIPWIPEELAYWLVRLRKWQQKYNPISKPTSWSKCKRTHLNELQLEAKGVNCFLFRAFNDVEPKNVGNALTNRLAAALYYVQPTSLVLATLSGRESVLSLYKSKYTPHSMRVSLITAYIMDMGMPVEIVMKVVGHSSIVMSIYYCKITQSDIRKKMEEGEKIALKSKAEATQKLIEQNNLEEVKNHLVANNQELLLSLTNEVPAGNFMFRDYGICPYAASRCHDGGEAVGATQVWQPTPAGYLGIQNCVRCRHFITGPAFLGGLISVSNEILLVSNSQSRICAELQEKIDEFTVKVNLYEREEYLAKMKGLDFDVSKREEIETRVRKLESEYESAAKKVDMFLCDLQACYKLVKLCQSLVNNISCESNDEFSLVKMPDAEMVIDLEETTYFQQLQEVCENASIYQSASAENAIIPRSQLLDRMAQLNNIAPNMFMMSQEQQLEVGNQIVKLLLARLKTWERVNEVVDGNVRIEDLVRDEKILPSEIEFITQSGMLESQV